MSGGVVDPDKPASSTSISATETSTSGTFPSTSSRFASSSQTRSSATFSSPSSVSSPAPAPSSRSSSLSSSATSLGITTAVSRSITMPAKSSETESSSTSTSSRTRSSSSHSKKTSATSTHPKESVVKAVVSLEKSSSLQSHSSSSARSTAFSISSTTTAKQATPPTPSPSAPASSKPASSVDSTTSHTSIPPAGSSSAVPVPAPSPSSKPTVSNKSTSLSSTETPRIVHSPGTTVAHSTSPPWQIGSTVSAPPLSTSSSSTVAGGSSVGSAGPVAQNLSSSSGFLHNHGAVAGLFTALSLAAAAFLLLLFVCCRRRRRRRRESDDWMRYSIGRPTTFPEPDDPFEDPRPSPISPTMKEIDQELFGPRVTQPQFTRDRAIVPGPRIYDYGAKSPATDRFAFGHSYQPSVPGAPIGFAVTKDASPPHAPNEARRSDGARSADTFGRTAVSDDTHGSTAPLTGWTHHAPRSVESSPSIYPPSLPGSDSESDHDFVIVGATRQRYYDSATPARPRNIDMMPVRYAQVQTPAMPPPARLQPVQRSTPPPVPPRRRPLDSRLFSNTLLTPPASPTAEHPPQALGLLLGSPVQDSAFLAPLPAAAKTLPEQGRVSPPRRTLLNVKPKSSRSSDSTSE